MTADLPDSSHVDGLGHDAIAAVLHAQHAELTARLQGLVADHQSMVTASADSNADDERDPEGQTIPRNAPSSPHSWDCCRFG